MTSMLFPEQIIIDLEQDYKELKQVMDECLLEDLEGSIKATISIDEVIHYLVEYARIRMHENYVRRCIAQQFGSRFQDNGYLLSVISASIVNNLWDNFNSLKLADEYDDLIPYRFRQMLGSSTVVLQFMPKEPKEGYMSSAWTDFVAHVDNPLKSKSHLF